VGLLLPGRCPADAADPVHDLVRTCHPAGLNEEIDMDRIADLPGILTDRHGERSGRARHALDRQIEKLQGGAESSTRSSTLLIRSLLC
jgi:hypothetical protein